MQRLPLEKGLTNANGHDINSLKRRRLWDEGKYFCAKKRCRFSDFRWHLKPTYSPRSFHPLLDRGCIGNSYELEQRILSSSTSYIPSRVGMALSSNDPLAMIAYEIPRSRFGHDRQLRRPDIRALALDPLDVLLAAGTDDGLVLIFDLDEYNYHERITDASLDAFVQPIRKMTVGGKVSSIAWNPLKDGELAVALKSWVEVIIFNLGNENDTPIHLSDCCGRESLQFSSAVMFLNPCMNPNKMLVTSLGPDGGLRLWRLYNPLRPPQRLDCTHASTQYSKFSAICKVGTSSILCAGKDCSLHLWDTSQRIVKAFGLDESISKPLVFMPAFPFHPGALIEKLVMSNTGDRIVIGIMRSLGFVFDLKFQSLLAYWNDSCEVSPMDFMPACLSGDCSTILYASSDGKSLSSAYLPCPPLKLMSSFPEKSIDNGSSDQLGQLSFMSSETNYDVTLPAIVIKARSGERQIVLEGTCDLPLANYIQPYKQPESNDLRLTCKVRVGGQQLKILSLLHFKSHVKNEYRIEIDQPYKGIEVDKSDFNIEVKRLPIFAKLAVQNYFEPIENKYANYRKIEVFHGSGAVMPKGAEITCLLSSRKISGVFAGCADGSITILHPTGVKQKHSTESIGESP